MLKAEATGDPERVTSPVSAVSDCASLMRALGTSWDKGWDFLDRDSGRHDAGQLVSASFKPPHSLPLRIDRGQGRKGVQWTWCLKLQCPDSSRTKQAPGSQTALCGLQLSLKWARPQPS